MDEEKIFVPVNSSGAVHGSVRLGRWTITIPCSVWALMCGTRALYIQANATLTCNHQEG